jgi:ubiquinone/menaquinone biosynthesis C-methylase UbiE
MAVMDTSGSESFEKIRQQFDNAPYPKIPLERSPKEDYNPLYTHNLVTSYYLKHQKVIDTQGKLILDAGCGTGYTSLVLAEANPGAKIVGVDISEESIKLARERLKYHGFENAEFHLLSVEDLPQLGLRFDYINCDEVLYLLNDPVAGLKAMRAVLQPKGIIRSNLHSSLQRSVYYRAQELFGLMGLMDENSQDLKIEVVTETMKSLKDGVDLKSRAWQAIFEDEYGSQRILANHLLFGDKGYTIPELFRMLEEAELDFISMVNWRRWEVTDLFADSENLPAIWAMGLMDIPMQDRLHLYELLNPVHRLLDFWCTLPEEFEPWLPVESWDDSTWQNAEVHLHPQIRTERVKQDLIKCITEARPFDISRYINLPTFAIVTLDSAIASCLLPLWEGSQPVMALAERRHKLNPLDPITLEPTSLDIAFAEVKRLLKDLDAFLYVLLE